MFTLKEIMTLNRRPVKTELDKKYPEIGVYCFGKGIFHKEPKEGFSLGNKKLFLVKEGDFIISITFAWEGAVALAGPSEDGMYCSVRFPTFIVDKEVCNPEYLLNFFRTTRGIDLLKEVSPGSAGRNRVLNIKKLLEKKIPLPPMEEQVSVVSKIKKLEKMQSVRNDLINDIELLRKSLLEAELERSDCSVISLSEVLSSVKRKMKPEIGSHYKLLGLRQEGKGLFVREEKEGSEIKANNLFLVKEGDFVYSRLFAWKGAYGLAEKDFDGCFVSNEFPTFKVDDSRIDPRFLSLLLCRKKNIDDITKLCTGTTKMSRNRLKEDRLLKYKISIPTIEKQKEIMQKIKQVDSLLLLQDDFVSCVEKMKTSILNEILRTERDFIKVVEDSV